MPATPIPTSLVPNLPLIREEGFEIQMEVPALDAAPLVRVLDHKTGDTHHLSLEAIEKIRTMAMPALRGVFMVNTARFLAHHPALNPTLNNSIRQGGNLTPHELPDGSRVELGNIIMANSESEPEWAATPREGEPKLTWQVGEYTGENCGWNLTLHGGGADARNTVETSLGFAPWNDPEAIGRLVNMLQDRQSVYVMAGVMDSTSTARLSSRMTALSMRRARKLPAIRLKQARDILSSAGLTGGTGAVHISSARGRVLPIQIDEASVPVAVAIVAPQRPNTCEPFPDGLNDLPWHEKNTIVRDVEQAGRQVWLERAKNALTEAGWVIVDLPLPTNHYSAWRLRQSGSQGLDYFYATRIKGDTWSEILPAAINAAENINLNRSSVL